MKKICIGCKKQKDVSEFPFQNTRLNIRHSKCKVCKKEYSRFHYITNKKYYLSKAKSFNKIYKEQFRTNMVEYLKTHPCVDCNEPDIRVLEFDHIDRKNKKYDVSRMIHHAWSNVLKEIEKCEVRCANCHRKKTVDLANSYKSFLK